MAILNVNYKNQMQKKLGTDILYTKKFFLLKRESLDELPTGHDLVDLAIHNTQQNWALMISEDFSTVINRVINVLLGGEVK